jgi:hypothetical protein
MGFSSASGASLSFTIVSLSTFERLQNQVAVDDHPHRETRPDRQGWLDVEVALNGCLSGLIHAVAGPAPKRGDDIGIGAGTGGRSKLAADAKQRRQECRLELGAPVIVDLVLETGKAGRVGASCRSSTN